MLDILFSFRQKTADEMCISDWSSDVCSSDLACPTPSSMIAPPRTRIVVRVGAPQRVAGLRRPAQRPGCRGPAEMARLSDAFIDDLLARTDIVEVINARVPLKRQGKEYSARCPFHDERSPSFTVSPTKQLDRKSTRLNSSH